MIRTEVIAFLVTSGGFFILRALYHQYSCLVSKYTELHTTSSGTL